MTGIITLAATTQETALIWAVILLGAALFLLFLELFVPSGGVLALVGAVASVGSVVCFFLYSTAAGTTALIIGLTCGPIGVWLVFRWWVSSPLGRRMMLGGTELDLQQSPEESYSASAYAQHQRATALRELIGASGVTETPLRPIGVVRVGDQRVDALSEHGIIEAGTGIIVTDAYDNQLKVRPMTPEDGGTPPRGSDPLA